MVPGGKACAHLRLLLVTGLGISDGQKGFILALSCGPAILLSKVLLEFIR